MNGNKYTLTYGYECNMVFIFRVYDLLHERVSASAIKGNEKNKYHIARIAITLIYLSYF